MVDLAHIATEFGDDPDLPSEFEHEGKVWRWTSSTSDAPAAWFFLLIDGDVARRIKTAGGPRRGFGSIKVEARIGHTVFRTSLFPSKERDGFLLPLKAAVRRAERLEEGETARVMLSLV